MVLLISLMDRVFFPFLFGWGVLWTIVVLFSEYVHVKIEPQANCHEMVKL